MNTSVTKQRDLKQVTGEDTLTYTALRRFTIKEAADILGVSTDTIRRMISRGELKAQRIGRQIRIKPADLDRAGKPVTRIVTRAEVSSSAA